MEYDIEISTTRTKRYFKKGTTILHREDGPAVEYSNGDKEWWINGRVHRIDGPAIETDAYNMWYVNGKRHRTDGPTITWADGSKFWWINGIRLSPEKEAILNEWWDNKNG